MSARARSSSRRARCGRKLGSRASSRATGSTRHGAWTLEGGSGVVERQQGIEGIESALDAWLLRRTYVDGFDSARDAARCEDVGDRSERPARGSTSRSRCPSSARRSSPSISRAARSSRRRTRRRTASRSRTTYEAWSEPSATHVRWPRKTIAASRRSADVSTQEYGSIAPGPRVRALRRLGRGHPGPRRRVRCAACRPLRGALAGRRPAARSAAAHLPR